MKNVKSLLSIVLCICLIATAFVGCSKKSSLEGTWVTTIDLTQEINDAMYSNLDDDTLSYLGDLSDPLSVDLLYTFDEDNNYTITVDEDKLLTDLSAYMGKMIDSVAEATYKIAESQGMSRDELDDFYMSEYGITLKGDLADKIDINDTVNDIVDSLVQIHSQSAIIEGDRIYEVDEYGNKTGYETFTLDGDVLTITGEYNIDDTQTDDNDMYPITLTKQG
jgi:hypothetical protein